MFRLLKINYPTMAELETHAIAECPDCLTLVAYFPDLNIFMCPRCGNWYRLEEQNNAPKEENKAKL